MGFACPLCKKKRSLVISHSIELPAAAYVSPDTDELSLQVVACDACGFRGAAVYKESRRGKGESWHHYCFAVPTDEVGALAALIDSCPARSDRNCSCSAHKTIGRRDIDRRWTPPIPIDALKTFPMQSASEGPWWRFWR